MLFIYPPEDALVNVRLRSACQGSYFSNEYIYSFLKTCILNTSSAAGPRTCTRDPLRGLESHRGYIDPDVLESRKCLSKEKKGGPFALNESRSG